VSAAIASCSCRVWTPKYWTSESIVAFNFTGFMDYQSGISHTQWGVGSKPFAADVVALQDVAVPRVLKDVKYSGGTKKKMWVVPMVSGMACDQGRESAIALPSW